MTKSTQLTPRGQKTRERILKSAQKIIRAEGFEGLSLRKIAGEIDYTATAIYEYFSGKEDLVDALCTQADIRLKEYLQAAPAALPIGDHLVEIGMGYIRFAVENPEEFLILFSRPNAPADETEMAGGSFTILYDAVKTGMEAGVFDSGGLDTLSVSYAAWAFVHGMATLRLTALKETGMDFDPINRWALTRFMKGMEK